MNFKTLRSFTVGTLALLTSLFSGTLFATTWTVNPGGGADYTSIQSAINAGTTVNGDTIFLQAATYSIASTITVSKELTIEGASIASATVTDSVNFGTSALIKITASNVTLENLTVSRVIHDPNGTVIDVDPDLTNIVFQDMEIRYTEFAAAIFDHNSATIQRVNFVYQGPLGNTNRIIGLNGSQGNFIIRDNTVTPASDNRTIFVFLTAAFVPKPFEGTLTISNNTFTDTLRIFFNMEAFQGPLDGFNLDINNNTFDVSNAPIVFFTGQNVPLDLFHSISVTDNTDNSTYGANSYKGLIVLDGTPPGSPLYDVATDPASIFYLQGNMLATPHLINAPNFADATNGSGVIGYNTLVFNPFAVQVTVLAPEDLTLTQGRVRFATQGDFVNTLTWSNSDQTVVGFHLFRDSPTNLIATIQPAMATNNVYYDHQRAPGQPTTYYLSSFDNSNNESAQASITGP